MGNGKWEVGERHKATYFQFQPQSNQIRNRNKRPNLFPISFSPTLFQSNTKQKQAPNIFPIPNT
ncbi:hypothetical protein ASE92_00830 [Pedobacter sp. Leaf41]|nr:hypothetical protein ASE92_00830 [Pedobacter sp. Leaf41]